MEDGYRSLAWLAGIFGDRRSEEFRERSGRLAEAIEKYMGEKETGYCNGVKWPSLDKLVMLNWVPLYARRWHPGRSESWDRYWQQLVDRTSLDWDGFRLVTCELPRDQFRVYGKVFAAQLGFCAATGRLSELQDMIKFASKTITHPLNLYPEWWFHHRPEVLSDCMKRTLGNHQDVYESYCENPEGDYTYDSGNCEQCAAFLHDVWQNIAGIIVRPDHIEAAPALRSPMEVSGGPKGLAWHWDGSGTFEFSADCQTDWQIKLPVSKNSEIQAVLDGRPLLASRVPGQEIDWLVCELKAVSSGRIALKTE